MKKIISKELQNELHEILDQKAGCGIQHDGWTCGTCFFSISDKFTNCDWQTVLAVRGDTKISDLNNLPKNIEKRVLRIIKISNNN